MKNILIFIVLMLITFMTSKSQSFEVGVKSGLGVSNIHLTNIDELGGDSDMFSSNFSYSVNGFLDYKGNGNWGFSIEPGTIRKGWKSNNGENNIKILNLQLPILSNFYISKKISFSIGPEINYLLSAKSELSYDTQNVSEVFNNFDLSAVAGMNYKLANNLDIGLKYSHGLTEMTDKMYWIFGDYNQMENPIEMKDYNQYIQLFMKIKLKNLR